MSDQEMPSDFVNDRPLFLPGFDEQLGGRITRGCDGFYNILFCSTKPQMAQVCLGCASTTWDTTYPMSMETCRNGAGYCRITVTDPELGVDLPDITDDDICEFRHHWPMHTFYIAKVRFDGKCHVNIAVMN